MLDSHLQKKTKNKPSFLSDAVLKNGLDNKHNELVTTNVFSQKDNFVEINSNVFEGSSNNKAPMEDVRKFFSIIKTKEDELYKNQWGLLFSKVFLILFCNATFIVLFLFAFLFIFKEKIFVASCIFIIMIGAAYIVKWIHSSIDPYKKNVLNNLYNTITSYSRHDIMKSYVSSSKSPRERRSIISYDDIIKGNRYSIFIGFIYNGSERGYEVFCISHNDSYSKFNRNMKSFKLFHSEDNPIHHIHNNKSSNHFGKDDGMEYLYGSIGDDINIGTFLDETRIMNYKPYRSYDSETRDNYYHFYNQRVSFNIDRYSLVIKDMNGRLACYDKDGYRENND